MLPFDQSFFCLNGGICYRIPSVTGPFCKCSGKFTGTRCEGIILAAEKPQARSEYLVNILVLAAFLGLIFIGLICFLLGEYPAQAHTICEEDLIETYGTAVRDVWVGWNVNCC
uniref:EGF-like domain-containing protein n=1 Tax=Leptobrachium leishanense TaxID=445787 RepID=A0A8C5MH61_9ANUR